MYTNHVAAAVSVLLVSCFLSPAVANVGSTGVVTVIPDYGAPTILYDQYDLDFNVQPDASEIITFPISDWIVFPCNAKLSADSSLRIDMVSIVLTRIKLYLDVAGSERQLVDNRVFQVNDRYYQVLFGYAQQLVPGQYRLLVELQVFNSEPFERDFHIDPGSWSRLLLWPDDQGARRDCDQNLRPDACDVVVDPMTDCNSNAVPDSCDVAHGTSHDLNTNGIPDECDPDCNMNAVPDDIDLASGASFDCNESLIPDECEGLEDCSPPSTASCPQCDLLCDGITDGIDIAAITGSGNFGRHRCAALVWRADTNHDGNVSGLDVATCTSSACFGL